MTETTVDFWLISLHDVNVETSTFGAIFRLIYRFSSPGSASRDTARTVGARTYFDPRDFKDEMPGKHAAILNIKSGGIRKVDFYDYGPSNGLLFRDASCKSDELI